MTSQISSDAFFNQLVNDLCIELSFRAFQKQMTINSVCPHCNQHCENIHERSGLDIYGNRIDSSGVMMNNQGASTLLGTSTTESSSQSTGTNGMLVAECPCCKKVLAATKFAPHLEKCMGMGRSARKRGNLMMKMAAGSENESDDGIEIVTRTPALPTNEESFSQNSSASKMATSNSTVNEAKKVKVSPSKAKTSSSTTTTPGNNSKSNSPSKNIKKSPPSKGKQAFVPLPPSSDLKMADSSNLLFNNLEDQENSTSFLTSSANLKNKISEGQLQENIKIGTPRAKNVLSNRKVLAEKTPNNIKRPFISPTKPSSSPSLLNTSTPLAQHPSLKEIADTTKTLTNPPDLFLQPLHKRRNVRKSIENKLKEETAATSKLAVVFPTTSDELDLEEIEHAASSLVHDDDSINFLSGTSKIIPNLELHENLDFSYLLSCGAAEEVDENKNKELVIVIEPIIVEFKLEEEKK